MVAVTVAAGGEAGVWVAAGAVVEMVAAAKG